MNTSGLGWVWMSLIAMVMIIPSWLGPSFFEKNFHVRPEVFMIWYFVGVVLGSSSFLTFRGISVIPSFPAWILILGIGFTLGTIVNILLFAAIPIAPNPSLPPAIVNVSSVGVFIAAFLLWRLLPAYFSKVQFDIYHLLGMLVTIVGLYVMVRPR